MRKKKKLLLQDVCFFLADLYVHAVGNYEYANYWILHMDGKIEFEMKATGIINTGGCVPGQPPFGGKVRRIVFIALPLSIHVLNLCVPPLKVWH